MKHKKLLIAVVVVAPLLVASAIGNYWDSKKPAPTSSPTPSASEPSPASVPAVNPLMAADFKIADVLNGFDEKIGEYGYVEIKKSDMEAISADQLTEFCKDKCGGSGLNFVCVLLDDGTGLHINVDSWFVSIPYGTVDQKTGQISEELGYIAPSAQSEDGTTPSGYEYISSGNS